MQIVTGRRGEPHVTSRQMQAVYRSFLGDFALLDVGNHLAATATAIDNVRISDGVVAVQGIYAVIAYNEYDDNYIEPVSVGMKRIDTLILHYTKSNDIEDMQIEVVEGEEVVDNPVAPTISEGGDAWEGTADIKVPIYDVLVTSFGLTVTPYSRMNTLIPTLDSVAERIPESIVTGVKGDSEALYRNGNVNITKENIGLGNVDNTADTDKPISTATQTALNLKADLAYVNAKIASVYHPGGSKTVAELTSALLIADNEGKVYNMSDSGVTTADFVEGAGYPIPVGSNVEVFNTGTEESPVYKFDLLPGFVDMSAYATTSAVNTGLAGKVDKVIGKGLSTNDYTNAEKQKNADNASAISDIQEDISTSLSATGNPLTIESSESNLVECTAEVEAYQDLHGYEYPWVGGAGKNKFNIDDASAGGFDKSGETFTNNATDTRATAQIVVQLYNGTTYVKVSEPATGEYPSRCYCNISIDSAVTQLRIKHNGSTRDLVIYLPWTRQGNYTISFLMPQNNPSTVGGLVIKDIMICENDYYTPYLPYSNISPITGQTEVVITDNGINQWDEEWEVGDIDNNGQNTSSSTDMRSKNYVKVFPNTAYYYKQNSSHTTRWFKVFYYDKNKTFISKSEQQGSTERTTPSNCYYVRFAIYGTFEDNNISINYPSTDHDYHAYAGKTYRVEIGQKNKLPMTVDGIKSANTSGTWSGNAYTVDGVTFELQTDSDGNITGIETSGTATNTAYMFIATSIELSANGILNGCPNQNGFAIVSRYTTPPYNWLSDTGSGITIDFERPRLIYVSVDNGINANGFTFYPMLRSTIDDSEFAPYNPNLPDAIYGGELDVLTGELTVTHGEVDLGDCDWVIQNIDGNNCFITTLPNKDYTEDAICSQYSYSPRCSTDGTFSTGLGASTSLYVRDSRYSDTTAFKTAMSGVQLVYELAEPYTIQLTPQQIRLLEGTNHLSCNTGDLSIKYYPDNVLGQLKGDIEKGLNAYYDYQIQALWDKIGELQA